MLTLHFYGSEVEMLVLVTYDVNVADDGGSSRLRRVAKKCESFGQRVQNSVFECVVDPAQLAILKHDLEKIINKKKDSIRYYNLGKNYKTKVDHVGAKESYDPTGPLVI